MLDNFVIYAKKKECRMALTNMSIHVCSYTKIRELSKRVGIPMTTIIDMMVDYSLSKLEVK